MRVVYDDGVRVDGTVLWLDSPRTRHMTFLSSPSLDPLPLGARTLLSSDAAGILSGRLKDVRVLPVDYHRPFSLGELDMELLPDGVQVGSGHLLLTRGEGESLLYARDPRMSPNLTAPSPRLPKADVLVMGCLDGDVRRSLPPRGWSEEAVLGFVSRATARGNTPVLLTERHGLAQELVAILGREGLEVYAHRSLLETLPTYRARGVDLQVRGLHGPVPGGGVVVWPGELDRSKVLARLGGGLELAAVVDPAGPSRGWAVDVTMIPLSLHGTFDELLQFVASVEPREIWLTVGEVEAFAQVLGDLGHEVRVLPTPRQASLDFR